MQQSTRMSATAVQFVLLALIWGSSFLFMKVALTGVSFGQIAWSRAILGALVLGIVMIVARQRLPREPVVWAHFVVIAVTNCVIPHLAFAWAEQHVSSSIASIYNSFTPIATAVLAALVYKVEKLTGRRIVGVLLGIVGVIVIIAPWNIGALTGDVQGQLACLLAAISYGVAIGYIRRFISHREISGITVAFMNIGMAAAIMLVLTPLLAVGEVQLDFWVVSSLLLLGGLGTGLAYIWNIGIIRAWGADDVIDRHLSDPCRRRAARRDRAARTPLVARTPRRCYRARRNSGHTGATAGASRSHKAPRNRRRRAAGRGAVMRRARVA